MQGPIIAYDLPLGDIVYTRYGSFNPIIQRDRFGSTQRMIYAPDGKLIQDEYHLPFKDQDDIKNPFDKWSVELNQDDIAPPPVHVINGKKTKLFGPGYLILNALSEQPAGTVFQAVDLRTQALAGLKILKQGRRFCKTDCYNRDMRNRLQYQAILHQSLMDQIPIPQADPYFEVKGDGYLPLEWLEGNSIKTLVVQTLDCESFGVLATTQKKMLLDWCQKLIQIIVRLHNLGYVHRDLTASNIWLGENDKLYLLNLELCHALNDTSPAYELDATSFMSPQQVSQERPAIEDDLYSIGCFILFVLTGIDPSYLLEQDNSNLLNRLMEITQGAPRSLLDIIVQCVNSDPSLRPSLVTISSVLSKAIAALKNKINIPANEQFAPNKISNATLDSVLTRGIVGLLQQDGAIQTEEGLWLSTSIHKQGLRPHYELRQSAGRGVAGVVYALSRFARFNLLPPEGIVRVKQAANWLQHVHRTLDTEMPGLYVGSAGVAVALAETIAANIEKPTDSLSKFIQKNLAGTIDWPDITYGAAGQGVANMYCLDRLGWPCLQNNIQRCIDYLIETQQQDGSWITPRGADEKSGEVLPGFAHGVAGIAYFLAEFAFREKEDSVWASAVRALRWLQKQAVLHQSRGNAVLSWRNSKSNPSMERWWCHGGPGVALAFLRAYELSGDSSYASTARKALMVHPINLRHPNLGQCHGLSGLGDIYVEAFRVLGEAQWLERATSLAQLLCEMGRSTATGELYWLTQNPQVSTADLMVGNAGILHFLMRIRQEGQLAGPALLLDKVV